MIAYCMRGLYIFIYPSDWNRLLAVSRSQCIGKLKTSSNGKVTRIHVQCPTFLINLQIDRLSIFPGFSIKCAQNHIAQIAALRP